MVTTKEDDYNKNNLIIDKDVKYWNTNIKSKTNYWQYWLKEDDYKVKEMIMKNKKLLTNIKADYWLYYPWITGCIHIVRT